MRWVLLSLPFTVMPGSASWVNCSVPQLPARMVDFFGTLATAKKGRGH